MALSTLAAELFADLVLMSGIDSVQLLLLLTSPPDDSDRILSGIYGALQDMSAKFANSCL